MEKFILQLFANSKSGSETNSTSHTEGGSNTSTSTVGGSHTESDTHTVGGSHSYSYGKQWASGEVEENTKQHRDAFNTDYSEGQKVTDAYNRLQQTLDQKPTFQSQYESKLNDLYDSIMNREKFNYNFNADQMYQMYKDNYTQQGKQAMEDTMGQAQAMNGGYGSSYAQSVGQQTYQNYLRDLNTDVIPMLRNQAYQQYQDEGTELYNKYGITSDAYNREYGQYRDQVADWQSDRSFNQSAYQDERNFDYNQFTTERNYWNDEYWKERNSEWSNYQVSDTNYWEDSHTSSDTNYWENSNSSSTSFQDTTNHSTTNNWAMSGGGSSASQKANNNAFGNSGTNGLNLRDPRVGYDDSRYSGGDGYTYNPAAKYTTKPSLDWQYNAGNVEAFGNTYNVPYNSDLVGASSQTIEELVKEISAGSASQNVLAEKQLKKDLGLTDEDIKALREMKKAKSWY